MHDGLKDEIREQILKVLVEYPAVEKAVLFGSRAMGTYTVGSDIDLALSGRALTQADVAKLSAHFAESSVPQKVDLVHYDSIDSQDLLTHIREHGVSWVANGNWTVRSLYEVADYINGRATKPKELISEGVPVIKIAELRGGLSDSTNRISTDAVKDKHWVSEGDLLFAWSGSVGIHVYRGPKAALNQHIFRVVARPGMEQGFLRYLLLGQMAVFERFVDNKRTTMGHVTVRDLQATPVLVPPIEDQRKIASVLSAIDDKIELNRRMSATLEVMARALFKSWFVDFDPVRAKAEGRDAGLPKPLADLFPARLVDSELGEVPEGWEVLSLLECVDVARGLSYKGSGLSDDGTPMHNLNSIFEGGGYKFEGLKRYSGAYKQHHVARAGDLIVANTEQGHDRLLIGYAAIVPACFNGVSLFSHHTYRVRLKKKSVLTSDYLVHLLNTSVMHDTVSGYANGTTVNMLPTDGLQSPLVVVPPPRAVRDFSEIAERARLRREWIVEESRTLAALRDALLPKLTSGDVRLADPARILGRTG